MTELTARNPSEQSTPAIAIASVILSMGIIAIGNGLMFAYIPLRLASAGYDPVWAGSILTGLSAGGIVGCFFTGWLVKRVGHARSYMVFSAIIALSNCVVAIAVDPWLWIAARALYGLAIAALFIVSQSWLNDVVSNDIRGRVMAILYVAYVAGLGVGYYLLGIVDISGAQAPLICIATAAFSMLPVGLTRLAQPPPPAAASISLIKAWRISPVAVAGMLAVGGLSMTITGFAPIHMTESGYGQSDVALLMSFIPLGTIAMQIPFGWLSDRTDRRYVMLATSVVALAGAAFALGFDGSPLVWLIPIYVVWEGGAETLYSLANAHAGDRATKEELVTLSSAMLFAWSISGFVVPGVVTIMMAFYGTQAFMFSGIGIAFIYSLFVAWRIVRAPAVPKDESGAFAPMSAQTPLAVELSASEEGR